jgi:hypothetical protein
MSWRRLFGIAFAAGIALGTGSAVEASCTQGSCVTLCENHVFNARFEDSNCAAWTFGGSAAIAWQVDDCSEPLLSGNEAVVEGINGQGAVGSFYQDIDVPTGVSATLQVGFMLDILGPDRSWWDRLRVTLRDPSTNLVLETLADIPGTSPLDCSQVWLDVVGDYRGESVRLYFEGTIWTEEETQFVLDEISFITF